ncbi:MAG: hypothetical protein AABX01_04355 [Candidatus Micrarchaeota archaeon]
MAVSKLIIAGLVAVILIGGVLLFASAAPGQYDSFAQCLTKNNAVMYGAYWCSHCANQKKDFGNSFKYVNYVECDAGGVNAKVALCRERGITSYPTWEIGGKMYTGEQNLATLSALTSCPLTSSTAK